MRRVAVSLSGYWLNPRVSEPVLMPKAASDIRKPQIVQAAFRAIAKGGLPLPSYDAIAREAGISRQLIRHHFPDPAELIGMLCDTLAGAYRDLMTEGIKRADGPERLSLFLDFYFGFLSEHGLPKPEDDQVYDAMFAIAAGSEAIRTNLREQYSLLRHVIAHEVQVSYPQLHQRACREIGFLFVSLMYGHWKMVASLGFSDAFNKVSRQAMDRIITSYLDHYEDDESMERL